MNDEKLLKTPDPVANLGPLSIESAQSYLDGWLGRNDLRVGPNMLAWALESSLSRIRELEGENARLNDHNVELSILAHGWMVAHDCRAADTSYDYPSPADVPAAISRALASEARVLVLEGALTPLVTAIGQLYEDNPILCDCVDNSGRPYTSMWLASQMLTIATHYELARSALSPEPIPPNNSTDEVTE